MNEIDVMLFCRLFVKLSLIWIFSGTIHSYSGLTCETSQACGPGSWPPMDKRNFPGPGTLCDSIEA